MKLFPRILAASTFALFLLGSAAARADLSNVIFVIEAIDPENDETRAQWWVPQERGEIDGDRLRWNLSQPITLRDPQNGELLGTLADASTEYINDPVVNLNFAVLAGDVTTKFVITSALMTFSPILNPEAFASAAITTSDSANFDGTLLTGNGPLGGSYTAYYNGGLPATGTIFASHIPMISSAPLTPGLGSGDTGVQTIMDSVSSMSAEFTFFLSPGDQANGTSTFSITPEPSAGALLALGMLLMRRR